MAAMDAAQRLPALGERIAALEADRPHLATKADVFDLKASMERQTRLLILWFVGTWIATVAVMLTAISVSAFITINSLP